MWDDHPFSESDKITKRTVEVEGETNLEGRKGVRQNVKRSGSICNVWEASKRTTLPTMPQAGVLESCCQT